MTSTIPAITFTDHPAHSWADRVETSYASLGASEESSEGEVTYTASEAALVEVLRVSRAAEPAIALSLDVAVVVETIRRQGLDRATVVYEAAVREAARVDAIVAARVTEVPTITVSSAEELATLLDLGPAAFAGR